MITGTNVCQINPIVDGHFGVAHGWEGGGAKSTPSFKTCHTYPTMMKLDTAIPYLKEIQKIYESRDTPTEFR